MTISQWIGRKRIVAYMGFCVTAWLSQTQPNAEAASSCSGAGYLCFYDYGTLQYGNVAGNNSNWTNFGWNDRADWFRNDGRTHNACVYEHKDRGGSAWHLSRGEAGTWSNLVSSNWWTTGNRC